MGISTSSKTAGKFFIRRYPQTGRITKAFNILYGEDLKNTHDSAG
jgi:hypothetical protein